MPSHRENPQAVTDITSDWATFREEGGRRREAPSLEKLNEDVDLLFHVTSKMLGDTNGGNDSICNICEPVYNGTDPTPVKFDVPERVQPPCSRRCSDWTNIKNKEHMTGKAHEKFREAGRDAAAATPYLGPFIAAGNTAARAYGLYTSANPTPAPTTTAARKALLGFGNQEYNQRPVQSEFVGGKSRRKRKSKSRKSRRKRKSKSRRNKKSKSRKSHKNKRNKR